jgi:hypothetical protein
MRDWAQPVARAGKPTASAALNVIRAISMLLSSLRK